MALDPQLYDTYKCYKAGTAKLVSWLAATARATNLLEDVFSISAKSKRPKGKERKANRGKGNTYQIHAEDLTRMAEAIKTANKIVPTGLIRTFEEVIAREECAKYFEQVNTKETSVQASNLAHRHFIQILQETRRILVPLAQTMETQSSQINGAVPENNAATLGNIFEYLEVEEPVEWTTTGATKTQKQAKVDNYELEPSDEEVSFAIYCLFRDLTEIRYLVRQTWTDYREGHVALTTAALTANTAISVIRRLNEEFVVTFPRFDEHEKFMEYLLENYEDREDDDEGFFATYTGSNFKITSNVFFCQYTWALVAKFFMRGGECPFYQEQLGDTYHMSDDEIVLFKCLSLFSLFIGQGPEDLFQDQLAKGLQLVKKDNKLYTWVVFAVQMFVDARHILGKHLDRCIDESNQLQKWLATAIDRSLAFGKTNNVNEWHKLNTIPLTNLKNKVEILLEEDFFQKLLDLTFEDRAHIYSWGPFFFLRNHPMLLGLIIQDQLTVFHALSTGLAGEQCSVLTTIHLYNAIKLSRPSIEWFDLEKIIAWQDPSWIFAGKRPTDLSSCFWTLGLVMGVSISAAARDLNGLPTHDFVKRGMPHSPNRCRQLRIMSKYCDLSFNTAVKARRRMPSRASEEPIVMLEMMVSTYLEKELKAVQGPASKPSKQKKLDPLRMLTVFKDCIAAEEVMFRFDYLTLNQRCITLLRVLQKICIEKSPRNYPEEEWGGDRNMNELFNTMIAYEMGLPHLQPTRFSEASLMVAKLAGSSGDAEYKKAEARRSVTSPAGPRIKDDFKTSARENTSLFERALAEKALDVIDPDFTPEFRAKFSQIIIDDGSGLNFIRPDS